MTSDPSLLAALVLLIVMVAVVWVILVRGRSNRAFPLTRRTQTKNDAGPGTQILVDSISDALLIVGRDNTVRFANNPSATLLGRSSSELVGSQFALPSSSGRRTEAQVIRPDFTLVSVDIEVLDEALDYHGETCTLLAVRDASERKGLETELAQQTTQASQSELEFRALFQGSPLGISVKDYSGVREKLTAFAEANPGNLFEHLNANHGFVHELAMEVHLVDANDSQMAMFGFTDFAAYRRWWYEIREEALSRDNSLGYYARELANLLEQGETDVELTQTTLSGEKIRVKRRARLLDDKWSRQLSIQEDVTAARQAEERLRASEHRFRRAFESAGHGFYLENLDGYIVEANAAFCDLLGYTPDEILGLGYRQFHDVEGLAEDEAHAERLLSGEIDFYRLEKKYLHKDGHVVPVMQSVGLIGADRDVAAQFVVHVVDMTEMKNTQAQLIQSQKMEAVGNITAGIAHDFNNILGVVLGNLQLLQRKVKDDDTLVRFATTAIDATRRAADLTRRLLAFSRRRNLEPEVLSANDLITNMSSLLRRTLGEQIEIDMDLAPDLKPVRIDPSQMESALLNLTINARDAIEGGGKVGIETSNEEIGWAYQQIHPEARPGQYVCITFTDNGSGMPKEIQDRIFEPFFTTKEVGKGTGLGLAMIASFIRHSGGHIHVYSEIGVGTSFKLFLPSCADEDVGLQSAPNADFLDGDLPEGTETVLVVEDEAQVRSTVELLLTALGYTVLSRESADKALADLEELPHFDILLSDVIMPGENNGRQLADALRARFPGLPVVYMSGYPGEALKEEEDVPFLQKPFSAESLSQILREVLDGQNRP